MNLQILSFFIVVVLGFCVFAQPGRCQIMHQLTRREFSELEVVGRAAFFEDAIERAAEKEKVDPLLLWTIAYNETRFRPWLTSRKNAKGLMQFIPATAERFGLLNPYDAPASIFAAARYVKLLSEMFGGRTDSILAAYNAGEGTVSAFLNGYSIRSGQKIINSKRQRTPGGVPPYGETVSYVRRGVGVYKWLQVRKDFPRNQRAVANIGVRDPSTDPNVKSNQPIEIFYDPRSGNRFVIQSTGQNREFPKRRAEAGPVIVSPDIRSGIAASARTTFFLN